MSENIPRFELQRVYEDGSRDEPQIYRITEIPANTKTSRRGFIKTSLLVAGAAIEVACSSKSPGRTKVKTSPVPAKKTTQTPLTKTSKTSPAKTAPEPAITSQISKSNNNCGSSEGLYSHQNFVNAVAFHPDGTMLASVSSDKTIKLWSVPGGKLLKTLKGHKLTIYSVAFHPNGKMLASASMDKTIKLWSVPRGKLLKTLKGHTKDIRSVDFHPHGTMLASGSSDNTIKLWSVPGGELLKTLKGHTRSIYSVDFHPQGTMLATGSWDNTIKLWSMPDGTLLSTLKGHNDNIYSVAFHPQGTMLASGSNDKTIKLWSIPDGKLLKTLKGHKSYLYCIAFHPDGRMLASGSADKTIKLWSIPDGNLLKSLKAHKKDLKSIAYHPGGKIIASASRDKTIRLWSVPMIELLNCLVDMKAVKKGTKANTYTTTNASGQTITYTLPCGSPIPAGAVCTCNCVPGTYRAPTTTRRTSRSYCSCNKVCTCVPVYYCQAHELLHEDTTVRQMSRELLLLMGKAELQYMRWAASTSSNAVHAEIHSLIDEIRQDACANPGYWPHPEKLSTYLDHKQQIVSLMAAQLIQRQGIIMEVNDNYLRKANHIIERGEDLHLQTRARVKQYSNVSPG